MKITLEVKGMTCGNCEKAVRNALEALAGVASVVVHLDTGNVDVTYNEGEVTVNTIKEAIEDQGYEVA